MDFPTLRFAQAGATPQELAELEREFHALPAGAQCSRLAAYDGLASADLRDLIEERRAHDAGEGGEGESELEPGPLVGVVGPAGGADGEAEAEDGGAFAVPIEVPVDAGVDVVVRAGSGSPTSDEAPEPDDEPDQAA